MTTRGKRQILPQTQDFNLEYNKKVENRHFPPPQANSSQYAMPHIINRACIISGFCHVSHDLFWQQLSWSYKECLRLYRKHFKGHKFRQLGTAYWWWLPNEHIKSLWRDYMEILQSQQKCRFIERVLKFNSSKSFPALFYRLSCYLWQLAVLRAWASRCSFIPPEEPRQLSYFSWWLMLKSLP